MWILTLNHNDNETHHVFRSESALKVGRSHDYRHDPNALYIGDLKVPKTYITIKVGGAETNRHNAVSPLSIVFESRCTTKINGMVYKLASKDSSAFEKVFLDQELEIVVNANQPAPIQMRLSWVPVTLLVFSKRVQYNGVVQESPLLERVSQMVAQGIDIRITSDVTLASHYVALNAHVDFNFQLAVSRAIPVVSDAWCDHVTSQLSDVNSWLLKPRSDLYLQTDNMFTIPDKRRQKLLDSKMAVLDPESVSQKSVARLKTWLTCLGANVVVWDHESKEKLLSVAEVLVFVSEDKQESLHFGSAVNTQEMLWEAVVRVDSSLLTSTSTETIFGPKKPKQKTQEQIQENTQEGSKRRVRRKVERVSDTDFFSFTPITSSAPAPEEPTSKIFTPSMPESQKDSRISNSSWEKEEDDISSRDTQIQDDVVEHNPSTASSDDIQKSKKVTIINANNGASEPTNGAITDYNGSTTDCKQTKNLADSKSDIVENDEKLITQRSFAEAVISTKTSASVDLKRERAADTEVDEAMPCKVEPFILKPRRVTSTETHSVNPLYRGRKNFKTFAKKGKPLNFLTRTFITLRNDENQDFFDNHRLNPPNRLLQKPDHVLANEMPNVRGFQPVSSQLFVREDESEDEQVDFQSQSLINNRKLQLHDDPDSNEHFDEDDDDVDDVAFTFSKKS